MNRFRPSARASMISSPPRMSTSQSAARCGRRSMVLSDPAMDFMGASELLSSWPITRTSFCQARSSSSRRGWLRSAITKREWGSPPSRNTVRLIPQRPSAPGKLRASTRVGSPARQSPSWRSSAERPKILSAGWANNSWPVRLTKRRMELESNAKMATSISSMTVRSSAVASSAPSLCSCNTPPSRLISARTSPNASSRFAPRARVEKSPSRKAANRLAMVWSGRVTTSRANKA